MKEPDMKYKSRTFPAVIDLLHFRRAGNINRNSFENIIDYAASLIIFQKENPSALFLDIKISRGVKAE